MKNELSIPKGCTVLEKEEMIYVDGGSVTLTQRTDFLKKNYCLKFANGLIQQGRVKRMTQQEIAEEIFAHAVIYYSLNGKYTFGLGTALADYFVDHARVIDIVDGGDSSFRKSIYNMIWNA